MDVTSKTCPQSYLSMISFAYGPLLGLFLVLTCVGLSLHKLGMSHQRQLGARATVMDEL